MQTRTENWIAICWWYNFQKVGIVEENEIIQGVLLKRILGHQLLACLLLSFSALTLNNSMASLSTHKWTGHIIWTTLHHHLPSERMLFLSTNLKSVNTMDSALQGLKSQAKVNFPTVEFNFYQDFLFRVFRVIRFGKTVFCTRNRQSKADQNNNPNANVKKTLQLCSQQSK